MSLRGRVKTLDHLIPQLPEPKSDDTAGDALVDLLFEVVEAAVESPPLTDEEEVRVRATMNEPDKRRNPYKVWVQALREGRCRMPEVTAAIMREIMLAFAPGGYPRSRLQRLRHVLGS